MKIVYPTKNYSATIDSPIGKISIRYDDEFLYELRFSDINGYCVENDIYKQTIAELDEYFNGTRYTFDIPLNLQGTDFQKKCWLAFLDVAYGDTAPYINIAQAMNNPLAMRAVGRAAGHNPISIIIPCHRIMGINGNLTGYAGGLWRKEWLTNFEHLNILRNSANL
jgi:methylated-DNA-[protein]-cysteine S-methyltransferase